MRIDLSYDVLLELRFLITGSLPIELMDEIAKNKLAIYRSLSQDLRRPGLISGTRIMRVAGRKFEVLFTSDKRDDYEGDTRRLRVLDIEEVRSIAKR